MCQICDNIQDFRLPEQIVRGDENLIYDIVGDNYYAVVNDYPTGEGKVCLFKVTHCPICGKALGDDRTEIEIPWFEYEIYWDDGFEEDWE